MSKIDDILETFESAELHNSSELMSNAIYSKIQKTKQRKNNLLSFGMLSLIIVVLNVAVYNSVSKNESSISKNYSKEEVFKDISSELLVNSSQQK